MSHQINNGPVVESFRVRKNAASLKRAFIAAFAFRNWSLPRSKERGLIEACGTPIQLVGMVPLPRSKERGLIEAGTGLSMAVLSMAFRVRKNAASLKPPSGRVYWAHTASLPRSKERGLIEACRTKSITGRLWNSFRVRKNAASLKLRFRFFFFRYLFRPSAFERTRPH